MVLAQEVDTASLPSSGQDTAVGTDLRSSCCGTATDDTASLTATTASTVASAAASPATSSGSSSATRSTASRGSGSRGSRRQRKGRRGDQDAPECLKDLGTLDEQEAESKERPLQEQPDVERVSDQDQGWVAFPKCVAPRYLGCVP